MQIALIWVEHGYPLANTQALRIIEFLRMIPITREAAIFGRNKAIVTRSCTSYKALSINTIDGYSGERVEVPSQDTTWEVRFPRRETTKAHKMLKDLHIMKATARLPHRTAIAQAY